MSRRLGAEEKRRKDTEQKLATLEHATSQDDKVEGVMDADADEEVEALEPYERAVRFNEKEFGPDHAETKRAKGNLDEIRRRRFAAKKPSQQLRLLEAKLGRRRKAHSALEEAATEAKAAYDEAAKAVLDDRVGVTELEKEMARVKATLAFPAAGTALAFADELPSELLDDAAAKAELVAAEAALRAAQQAILAKCRPKGGRDTW